jgi:transcriptional regulator with PAS, ATPase and Fis domain
LVKDSTFREDLYYRINVVKLVLPPLRKRKEDIPLLAEHFLRKFSRLSGKEIQGFSPEVFPILMSHDFPGNIRELENMIEYATVVCKDHWIGIEHLPEYMNQGSIGIKNIITQDFDKDGSSWNDMERSYIYELLRKNNWSRSATASQMGIHTTTLWRKIKRLNIEIPKQNGRTKG